MIAGAKVTIRALPLTFFPDHLPLLLPSSVSGSHVSSLQRSIFDLFSTCLPFQISFQTLRVRSDCPHFAFSVHSFRIPNEESRSFHFSLPKKNVSRWLYCFLTTSPTQQGSTLPHLNWSENIYRQRLWSTHCHKVSQSFPKLIGPFVFLFSCADFEPWFHLDIYIERLTFRQTKKFNH